MKRPLYTFKLLGTLELVFDEHVDGPDTALQEFIAAVIKPAAWKKWSSARKAKDTYLRPCAPC